MSTVVITDLYDDGPTPMDADRSTDGRVLHIRVGDTTILLPLRREHAPALAAVLRQAAREVEAVTVERVPA